MASKLAVYDTGYEDERFEQIVSQSFHCIICTNVIKDAVMCPQNEHLFCRACITRHLMNFQTCPTCMEPLTADTLSQAPRSVRNLLAELRIRCEYFDRGCGTFIELGGLEMHVADCGFAPAVCSNEGCQIEVNKQDLLHHETSVCELRRVKCHSCNDIRQEMDTVKVNLALMNEKLDKNEQRLSDTLERIEKNGKAVENVFREVQLIQQQFNEQEVNNGHVQRDIVEVKRNLNEITKLLERMTRQTSHEVQDGQEKQEGIAEANTEMDGAKQIVCSAEGENEIINLESKDSINLESLEICSYENTNVENSTEVRKTDNCIKRSSSESEERTAYYDTTSISSIEISHEGSNKATQEETSYNYMEAQPVRVPFSKPRTTTLCHHRSSKTKKKTKKKKRNLEEDTIE